MKKSTVILKKIIALAIGVPVLVVGIILIPLPGPGLLITFLGLVILAREFEWAEKHADTAKQKFMQLLDTARARAEKMTEQPRENPKHDDKKTKK